MPVDDTELKERLMLAAGHGWTKPAQGTTVGDRLVGFLDANGSSYDAEFARMLQAVRGDWLSGSGVSLAGALHHSAWTDPPADPSDLSAGPRP